MKADADLLVVLGHILMTAEQAGNERPGLLARRSDGSLYSTVREIRDDVRHHIVANPEKFAALINGGKLKKITFLDICNLVGGQPLYEQLRASPAGDELCQLAVSQSIAREATPPFA